MDIKIFKIVLTAVVFIQSTSSIADELKIATEPPEAELYIRDFGGKIKQKLGKAPYAGNIQEITSSYAGSSLFMLTVEKEGYLTQSIALSDLLKSDIAMTINLEPIQNFDKYKSLDNVVSELFEAQKLVRSQQYDSAIEILKKAEEKEKNLSIIPEMIGAAFFLKKENKTALSYYKKAFRLNPENADAFKMKAYLEKSLGVESDKNTN